ncbi:hypothetical protein HANVADRAFT_3899, partial [Hanseniaspora valbyensis NRRL Y-1626]
EEVVSPVVEAEEEVEVVEEKTSTVEEEEKTPTVEEEEKTPTVEEEEIDVVEVSNPVQKEPPAKEEVASVVEEENAEDASVQEETAVEEEVVPVIEEEIEAVEKEAPLTETDAPVLEKETPIAEEEVQSVEEDTPIVEEEEIVIEKAPLAEESQIIEEEEEVPVVEEQGIVIEETENQLSDREDVKSTPIVEIEASEEKSEPIEKILAEDIEAKLPDHVDVPMHTKDTVEETTKTIQITEFEESNSEPVEMPTSETQAVYDKPTQFDEEKQENVVSESLDEQLEELFQENEVIEENIALDEL